MRTPATVRDAAPDDAAAISRVAQASWRDTYRDIFEPSFIEDFLARNYDEAGLARAAEAAASQETAAFLLAERDGQRAQRIRDGGGRLDPRLRPDPSPVPGREPGVVPGDPVEVNTRLSATTATTQRIYH